MCHCNVSLELSVDVKPRPHRRLETRRTVVVIPALFAPSTHTTKLLAWRLGKRSVALSAHCILFVDQVMKESRTFLAVIRSTE